MKFSNKRVALLVLILALGGGACLWGQAEFAIGAIIKGFELPQREADGSIKLKIMGKEATVMSLSRIKVRGLTIDFFNQGAPQTQISSEESDYWQVEKRLTTDKGVKVEHPNFVLTAQTMDWLISENRGTFQQNVKVVISQKEEAPTQ
ncbi:MAG: hypothetical protein HC904_01375 [Blastochloris sp.]|nr:hypothetical protein [Blastochloris sp.]